MWETWFEEKKCKPPQSLSFTDSKSKKFVLQILVWFKSVFSKYALWILPSFSYCYPCGLTEYLKHTEHTLYDCCTSLWWFKDRILVFLWKPLFFRWPVASHCCTQQHHSIQMQQYGWRYFWRTTHQTKYLCFRVCVTYYLSITHYLSAVFFSFCFLTSLKQQEWFF